MASLYPAVCRPLRIDFRREPENSALFATNKKLQGIQTPSAAAVKSKTTCLSIQYSVVF